MEAMTMLDRITTAVERVLKDARPVQKERMGPEALVAYAAAQVEKAAHEPAGKALRRLEALRTNVELAKQSFVDSASEQIEVQVFEEETTARADDSEKEISPVAAEPAIGNAAFASNPEDLTKSLARLAKDLEALRDQPSAEPGAVAKTTDAEWPFDMNSREFRDGVRKSEDAPDWGFDPGRDPTAKA
jgi:hypothetical protein